MILRSRKKRRTTVTARNSQNWATVSIVVLAISTLSTLSQAQDRTPPGNSSSRAQTKPNGWSDLARRSQYRADLSQIKYATLESEAVFFERLGKQNKIESMRIRVSEAEQKIQTARQHLSPAGTKDLED